MIAIAVTARNSNVSLFLIDASQGIERVIRL